MGELVLSVTARLSSTVTPLIGRPDRRNFRINRDVRFNADKRRLMTTASAVLSRDGSQISPGLVNFQSDADKIFAAVGFHMPMHDDLRPKSWAVSRSIPLRSARSHELAETLAELVLPCAALLEFGWSALEAA